MKHPTATDSMRLSQSSLRTLKLSTIATILYEEMNPCGPSGYTANRELLEWLLSAEAGARIAANRTSDQGIKTPGAKPADRF